jgi:N-acetylglucosamine kinase-like BadF-type ATPase
MGGGSVRAVCLGSAGVDSEPERIRAEKTLRGLVPANVVIEVRNDAAAALGLVGSQRPAMVVIAGTGSIAYGERADGTAQRVGGHGAILGDSGSGANLGISALRHTANVFDGVEQRGELANLIIKHLQLHRAADIVARVSHPDVDVPLVASLSPLVQKAFEAEDPAARTIVNGEAAALAAQARRLAYLVRDQSTLPVLLVGGIFSAFAAIRDTVKEALRTTGPVVVHESSECVHGAARLALELTKLSA